MRNLSRRETFLLLAILALSLGLRLYRLDAQSLWNDEGTSVALAQRDLITITRQASQDIHPPLYYYLLHYWVKIWGTSEFAVRALSALIGMLTVGATFFLAVRLFSSTGALLAALLAAVAPFQVYYSQEARMYILATYLGIVAMIALHDLLNAWSQGKISVRDHVALILASLAMLYTHYYTASLIVAMNLVFGIWWFERHRETRRWSWAFGGRWALIQGLTLLGFIPYLWLSWRTLVQWPAVSAPVTLQGLASSLLTVMPFGITVAPTPLLRLGGILLWLLAFAGGIALWWAACSIPARGVCWRALLPTVYLLIPLILIYLGSWRRPMYNPKFILLASPAFCILQAAGLAALLRPKGIVPVSPGLRLAETGFATALLGIILVGSTHALHNLYDNPHYARDDYRGALQYIEAAAGPRAAILINAPSQIETIDYYYDGPLPMFPLARQRPVDQATAEAELAAIARDHDQLFCIFWATADSDPHGYIEQWLAKHTFKTMDRWYGNIRLVVYTVPPKTNIHMEHEIDTIFGESIRLVGYTLLTPSPRSGEILQLVLYWQALEPIATRYKVFVQVLDAKNHIVGQHDAEPAGETRPTTTWQPGEIITDNHGILIMPGTIPGEHTLIVGLYDATTGQRLALSSGGSSLPDAVHLTTLEIAPALRLPTLQELGIQVPHEIQWSALRLRGHSLYKVGMAHAPEAPIHSGDVLELVLFWEKMGEEAPSGTFQALLTNPFGRIVFSAPLQTALERYPWDLWRDHEIVRDVHHIILPNDLSPGRYRLALQNEERRAVLQRVRITP